MREFLSSSCTTSPFFYPTILLVFNLCTYIDYDKRALLQVLLLLLVLFEASKLGLDTPNS